MKPGVGGKKANQASKSPQITNYPAGRKAMDLAKTLENKDDTGAEEDQREAEGRKTGGGGNKAHQAGNSSPK